MLNTSINRCKFGLWIAIFSYFILILVISISYHWGYMSSLVDLGRYDQAVWGTLHGHFMLNSHTPFNMPMNYFGIHFRPILLIFLPFYTIFPKAEWMILAQSFALSLTAWPIYLLAKRVSKSEPAALFWALIYLVNPSIINLPAWVFRPESLAVPFIAIAFLSIEKFNYRLLLLSCLFILLCKEHFGIMVIGFGVLWGIRNRRWKKGILLISIGTAYSILVLGMVMPALSPIGKHVMFAQGVGQLSRYSWLGNSLIEVFKSLLIHPMAVIKMVILEMGAAKYLLALLMFFFGLPLAAPEFLLPGIADLMANILSANPMPRSLLAYHSASLIPVLIVAAIYGAKRLSIRIDKPILTQIASFVLIANFLGGYLLSPLPLPGARNFWAPTNFLNGPDPSLAAIRSVIGDNSSVSAQNNIGAHFSQRREIYYYPNKVGEVDAIVLRLESPTKKGTSNSFQPYLGIEPIEYLASIEKLLANPEYNIVLWDDPWLVLKTKEMNQKFQQVPRIENKLKQLRKEWKIKRE